MSAEGFLIGAIVISLLIGLYNMWMMGKIIKGVHWILSHVHVVSKSQMADPELNQIRRTFGVYEETEDVMDGKE